MKSPDENKKDKDEIRVVSSDDDQKIKTVGEVLANESSRTIMKLLAGKTEMTINEISQEIELSIPLVSHHIKKMQDAGMVKVSRVGTSVKGHKMNYYCATNQSILITPPERKMHTLFASLKKISRFAAIGMAGLVSWAIVRPEDPESARFQSGESDSADLRMAAPEDEWSASYQSDFADESLQMKAEKEEHPESAAEPVESEPTPEPESAGIGDSLSQLAESERANTGSVTLDRTVYPAPFETTAAESAEPLMLSIIIPVAVIVGGIILERLLARRARNKINQIT